MLEQQRHRTGTSRSHTPNIILASLAGRVWCTKFQSSLPNVYFRFSGFDSRSYLFTSATRVRIGVHSAPKYGTKTIRQGIMTLHFRYRRAASLRHRNYAEITVVVCEPEVLSEFRACAKAIWYEHSLILPSFLRLAALQFANLNTANDMSFKVL